MRSAPIDFKIESHLAATRSTVWRHATSMASVNLELRPLIRMTYPREYLTLDLSTVDLQKTLFRSMILLFGVFPIDIYNVTMTEFEPGHRFLERSPTLTLQWWEHERAISDREGGCLVADRVAVLPRRASLNLFSSWFARIIFTNRHRNLRKLFDEPSA